MGVNWTADQLRAIESRDGTLLVSAAAGSGKTAVLVERLLRRVSEEGISIDKFLMITYTKAAASELRAKIISAISEKIAENPDDIHMKRQMARVHAAQISTIHAYCTQLLRTHGHFIGIGDDFKIIDEGEAEILRRKVLDDLLEEKYSENCDAFSALCDAFCDERSDRKLVETILSVHSKSRSHPSPKSWLLKCAADYELSDDICVEALAWGKEIMKYIRELCEYLVERMRNAIRELAGDLALDAAYTPALRSDIQNIEGILYAKTWDEMFSAVQSMEFMRLSPVRKCDNEALKAWFKSERDDVKKQIGKISEQLLCKDSETILRELRALYPIVSELCNVVQELEDRCLAEKRRRGVMDYSDLEHEALALLVEEYREDEDVVVPTPLARELSCEFCEIMVDEYQDSNCIQDVIFRAVSKDERNLTMVGDLKQSIYRFRLADPTIFLRKYTSFCEYEKAQPAEPRTVNLSQNFRSREEVISCCNRYFSQTMSERLGELNYTEREALNPGAKYPDNGANHKSELVLLDLEEDRETEEGELLPQGREVEARYIASRIKCMIDEKYPIADRTVEYGDIVVLLRSLTGRAEIYERAFREYGIPCVSDKSEGLIGTVEVGIFISFLQTISNPLWDVPLVSTLRSPMFGFSADDLAYIRRHDDGFFYDALLKTAREDNDCGKKCAEFLGKLSTLRDISGEIPTDELIWHIMDETGARGIFGAMQDGNARVSNLTALYNYAQRFEANGFRGLHAFLEHIAGITDRGEDIPVHHANSGECAVRIMSIHKSKGLEFPIVFLADCNRRFNAMDLREQVLVHPKQGLGVNFRDSRLRYECPSLARMCISLTLMREMKSEELRVLYVAMTRAREKLIAVCAEPNAGKRVEKVRAQVQPHGVSPIALLQSISADLWFMLPQFTNMDTFDLVYASKDSITPPVSYEQKIEIGRAELKKVSELERRFSYIYPHEAATYTEGKLTATGISHEGITRRARFVRPRFIEERGLTPTERGIALHLAMQLVDFAKCESLDGIHGEISRLCEMELLTKQQADAVDPNAIKGFFDSPLGKSVRESKWVEREFRFSRLIPVTQTDSALLQGVVDLMFEQDGALVLVDFKSDRYITEQSVEQYKRQLEIYAQSLELIKKQQVSRRVLFFLQHGKMIEC